MPSSAVRTFSNADEYATAIRGGAFEVTVIARGDFSAKHTRIDFHRLWMQRISESLPRVWHSAIMRGRAPIMFRTQGGARLLSHGMDMLTHQITRLSEGEDFYQLSRGPVSFGAMSLPVEDMAFIGATTAGSDLAPPRHSLIVAPRPGAMATLLRLHAAAGDLAKNKPQIIADPNAAHGLEQALLEAMAGCFDNSGVREDRTAQRQHHLIMRRFRRVLEENPSEPLYIPEICKAIGVAGRTLRTSCQEHLGMGPKRYLLLRRLNLVRQALRQAAPDKTTVTKAATEYGFWELGRFAGAYRSLFGETPSATLRRPPG